MITPADIKSAAERAYPRFVSSWIKGETFFPWRVRKKIELPADLGLAEKGVDALRKQSLRVRGFGYEVMWKERNSRQHGLNEFPVAISFPDQSGFLRFIGCEDEFERLSVCVGKLRAAQPELEDWLQVGKNWARLLGVSTTLDDLLMVVQWFLKTPDRDFFLREIPLPISTKLIEQNTRLLFDWLDRLLTEDQIAPEYGRRRQDFAGRYGMRFVRHHFLLRCLDPKLQDELGLPVQELSLPIHALDRLSVRDATVYIIENKVNLLTFPPQSRALALGGLGNAAAMLKGIHWLSNAPIFYWGDLDPEGFGILGRFRQMFPQTQSLMMDQTTYAEFESLSTDWTNSIPPPAECLTADEQALCDRLLRERRRLEQEHIPQSYVLRTMSSN